MEPITINFSIFAIAMIIFQCLLWVAIYRLIRS